MQVLKLKISKKLIVAVSAAVIGIYWIIPFPNFKWPVSTVDCSDSPTSACLDEAIKSFDYASNLESVQYSHYGRKLIEAGYYDKGIEILAKSDASLIDYVAIDWAAQQIADVAIANPNEIASFELLDVLKDPNSLAGSIINKKRRTPILEGTFFLKLSSRLLWGDDSGGGDINYVRFIERAALEKFRPNATWNEVVKRWRAFALSSQEPTRSNALLTLASQLYRAGSNEEAYEVLQLVKADSNNADRYAKQLDEVGKHQEAQEVRITLLPTYKNAVAVAEVAVKDKNSEAIQLLHDAVDAINAEESLKKDDRNKVDILRKISKLYYEVGDVDTAKDIADESVEVEKSGAITKSFISYTLLAKHYREIDQLEKSREIMRRFESEETNSCSPFADLGGKAKEFYHLGRLDLANQKISAFCDKVTVFGSTFGFKSADIDKSATQQSQWLEIYVDAYVTGKDTTEIVKYAGEGIVKRAWRNLAMYYLNHGEKARGEEFLAKAIAEGDYHGGSACDLSYLARSADRPDLLEIHFKRALKIISQEQNGLERQASYLQLSACHPEQKQQT